MAEALLGRCLIRIETCCRVPGVTLARSAGSAMRTVESGSNGQFSFTQLPPNVYTITVTAPGMKAFSSAQLTLCPGDARIVPPIMVSIFGGSTSVTVNGNKEALSKRQVQIAVQ